MSRTNKPRRMRWHGRGGHRYVSKHFTELKRIGNKWMRQDVRRKMKDTLFGDSFDEKRLPSKKEDLFNRWWYD